MRSWDVAHQEQCVFCSRLTPRRELAPDGGVWPICRPCNMVAEEFTA